jgi:hypothetical protein
MYYMYASRGKDRMDTRTVLIVVSVFTLVIIVCLVLVIRSRGTRRFNKRVVATITEIKVEASTMSSWWIVVAQWSDTRTGQTLIFRSPHLQFFPKYQIGEGIVVKFKAAKPKHYRMEL